MDKQLKGAISPLLFILCFVFMMSGCGYKEEPADLVVHNARIYTVDTDMSVKEAMAIKNGKIQELGAERAIMNKYSAERTVDAKQNPIYPGFIDAHAHFLGYGRDLQKADLVGAESYQEVLGRVKDHAEKVPEGWIEGSGWDHNEWKEKEFPTRGPLDSLFPDRPVLLERVDGHAALVNGKALEMAGISGDTSVTGGNVRTEKGKPTGILIDNAIDLVRSEMPEFSERRTRKALLEAQADCFKEGLTTVVDAGLSKRAVMLIDTLHREGPLKIRLYAMLSDTKENFDHFLERGPYKTERLNVRSFKFYADGALGSRGACLLEPYSDVEDSAQYGFLLRDPEYYRMQARKMIEHGFQMNTHCIGDSANRLLLDIYGNVLEGTNDKRWRIEHAQIVHEKDLDKFGKYNIIPSVQPTHATSDMKWADERLGSDRLGNAYALKELLDQNGMIPLGTDFPVEGIDPLKTFYAAVFRKNETGGPDGGFQPENALTREEALRGMTIWAAMANFEEGEKGSLEEGKFADFVILDQDIMKVPEEQVLNTEVVATYVNGEELYRK